jgi:MFS family permease
VMDAKAKKDFYILFITRSLRLFSYGSLAVVLFLYLHEVGFSESQIGYLMSFILLGDLVITMYLTTHADRFGRRKTLSIGALLKFFTGVAFAVTTNYQALLVSGIIGVISTSGGEIGPFIAIEQAALTDLKENITHGEIASLFGWYNLFGYVSQALGALFAGLMTNYLQTGMGYSKEEAYRVILYTYAFWGFAKWLLYNELS